MLFYCIYCLGMLYLNIYASKAERVKKMRLLLAEDEKGLTLLELLKNKLFWIMLVLMICAGACEQAVSQWASTFAEKGLHISKTMGDLTGPMFFAILMGSARVFYGKYGDKINLHHFMFGSGILCLFSYLLISLSSSLFNTPCGRRIAHLPDFLFIEAKIC